MKLRLNYFSTLAIFLLSFYAGASELSLQPYPNARELMHSATITTDYLLALGSYKKVDGYWVVDRSQHLSGSLERTTFELPANHTAEQGFNFYKEQLEKYNTRELFYCKARDCGTSNSWANNHFKIVQLYGLDQHQFYAAYEITSAEKMPYYLEIYAVIRGNKRAYVHLDILHVDKVDDLGVASSPETLVKILSSNSYYVFPDLVVKDSQENLVLEVKRGHIQALVEVLKLQPSLRIALVGHDYSAVDLELQQQASKEYAEQLKAALVAQGADPKRLRTFGVGGLAPAGKGDRQARVEVVKIGMLKS
jgi:hypothetical protein